jgi:tetratricopeptide (TPR) repeat protein
MFFRLAVLIAVALSTLAAAQQTPKVTLDTSESIFSVMAAINSCGYNQDLAASLPLRAQIRGEVANAVAATEAGAEVQKQLCYFYTDHQQSDPARNFAQYVSLALYLGDPPALTPTLRESDLPPDASYVLGLIPVLKRYYEVAGLHRIWEKHRADYDNVVAEQHEAVSNMLLRTDVYLKLPISGFLGRRFVIYLEPLAAPGLVNARNYGADYYMITAPEDGRLRLEQIRHTYLHFVLDPMALKHANGMKRLEPLLKSVQNAPMDDSYKRDASLLVTESLIRAIEARLTTKATEEQKQKLARAAVEEGFVLTGYFNAALAEFEKSPTGMRDAYGDLLYNIDLGKEEKHARAVTFRAQAAPEVVKASKSSPGQTPGQLLDQAEDKLGSGNIEGAQQLAQQALEKHAGDPARAMFILARAATLSRDMNGARTYFERTLEVARQPRMVAWSHIYLGRIFDLQENRDEAVLHYRAALAAGDPAPETKAAAERGLQQPYQPPATATPHGQTGDSQPAEQEKQ